MRSRNAAPCLARRWRDSSTRGYIGAPPLSERTVKQPATATSPPHLPHRNGTITRRLPPPRSAILMALLLLALPSAVRAQTVANGDRVSGSQRNSVTHRRLLDLHWRRRRYAKRLRLQPITKTPRIAQPWGSPRGRGYLRETIGGFTHRGMYQITFDARAGGYNSQTLNFPSPMARRLRRVFRHAVTKFGLLRI